MRKLLYTFILSLLALSLFAKKLTVNVTTAGGLSAAITAAGGNAALIDSLTVTGNINARDVKYMRDDMPILAVLDLEAVSIMEYKGNLGTSSSTSYPANEMPDYSFCNSSTYKSKTTLTKIIFPININSIGDDAFSGCTGLTGSLTIPDLVTSIGRFAFNSCSGFTGSLTIPSSVSSIGHAAFQGCTGLTGSLTIPDSVTSIGGFAFSGCKGLIGSLTIPNSVTSIGEYAFYRCSGFTGSLTIPSSVSSIGDAAFSSLINISNFSVDTNNPYFSSVDGILYSKDKKVLVQFPAGKAQVNMVLPNTLTTIGSSAFEDCKGLTGSLTIPNSVTSIGRYAFDGCSGFTGSLTIPNSVTSIGYRAFKGCSKINKLIVAINKPLVIDGSFDLIDKDACILIVPMGSKTAYQNAADWSEFKNIQEALMVMYNLNGGKADNASDTVVSLNSLIPEPNNPVREKYNFAGWYSDSTFTKTWDFSNDKVEDNVTLYAKWEIKKFPVYFMLDSITGYFEQSCKIDSLIKEPKAPEKKDCLFGGWYKDTTLLHVWDINTDKVKDTVFLYAKWQCKVMFYSYGEEIKSGRDTVDYNHYVFLQLNMVGLGKGNDVFDGWFTEPEFTHRWDFRTERITKNTNLYAKWVNTSAVNQTNNSAFEIYPNPAVTTLKLRGTQLQQISIYNLSGEVLLSKNLPGTNEAEVNISALKPGYYLLKAIDHGNIVAVKGFIKK